MAALLLDHKPADGTKGAGRFRITSPTSAAPTVLTAFRKLLLNYRLELHASEVG
jgi:hypothetical protein